MATGSTRRRLAAVAAPLAALLVLTACAEELTEQEQAEQEEAEQAERVTFEIPELGSCRVLEPADAEQRANSGDVVDCAAGEHTAQTFAVGSFPDELTDASYTDERLGEFVFETCSDRFASFIGGDESASLRSLVSWVWFRPTEDAWEAGARWYRCDVVGGADTSSTYRPLPEDATGLLNDRPDEWMACVRGPQVAGAERIPCSEPHDWRAATTIQLGDKKAKYPGDRVVEVRTRDFCRTSISAWLNYPTSYEFGYTWFREAEWSVGNRRSVCWAKTDQ